MSYALVIVFLRVLFSSLSTNLLCYFRVLEFNSVIRSAPYVSEPENGDLSRPPWYDSPSKVPPPKFQKSKILVHLRVSGAAQDEESHPKGE